jgi:hypothetical protein
MKRAAAASADPDIIASAKALRRAARRALELGLSTGTPVYVMQEGRIVDGTREARPRGQATTSLAVRETPVVYRTRKTCGAAAVKGTRTRTQGRS